MLNHGPVPVHVSKLSRSRIGDITTKKTKIKPSEFTKWVDVRDSIIHADSKATWWHGRGTRKLLPRFVRKGNLSFSESDLKEAFGSMLQAIGLFEHQVEKWERAKYGPPIIFKSRQA